MAIPGFAAGASLYQSSWAYRGRCASAGGELAGGVVLARLCTCVVNGPVVCEFTTLSGPICYQRCESWYCPPPQPPDPCLVKCGWYGPGSTCDIIACICMCHHGKVVPDYNSPPCNISCSVKI